MSHARSSLVLVVSLCILAGCGSDAADAGSAAPGSAQLPPTTGSVDLEAWLARGDYLDWRCETVSSPQRKVSPHGQNRICSNDLIVDFEGGVGDERPKGSAAVKELYDDDTKLVGYAVEVKTAETSDEGANWYWYERLPGTGVVADGFGTSGNPKTVCVGCHAAAGSDETHTVTGSSDYVYGVVN